MTATQVAVPVRRGHTPGRLIAAEVMKIRTTNSWWLLTLGVVLFTALALTANGFGHHYELYPPLSRMAAGDRADAIARAAVAHSPAGLRSIAADMLTSGQFFGCLLAMLIGILVVTNEYFHQTATATFMTNPHRTAVIMAKLVAAGMFGALFWLVSTILNVLTTPIYLHTQHVDVSLTQWPVTRSVLLNLLAFVMWAVFGLGLGTLIRSQIGAVVTGMVVYLIGLAAVRIIFNLIYNGYHHSWVLAAQVISPAVASQVMVSPGRVFDHAPPQYVGLLVMIGYAVLFGGLGIWLTRRRDIS